MAIRIVSNKALDMTNDEYGLYQKIVKSYSVGNNNGADLFQDLFSSNEQGIITFLIPPSKKHTTLEVFLFLVCLQQQQQLRLVHEHVSDICNQMKEKMREIDAKLQKI